MAAARVTLVHSSTHFGSTEQSYLMPLLERLDASAFEWSLITPDAPELAPVHALAARSGRSIILPDGGGTATIAAYIRTLRRLRPGLVHCVDVNPPAMLAARFAGVRRIVVTHHTPEYRPSHSLGGTVLRQAAWHTRPHIVFTSEFDRQTGLRHEPIEAARTHVIPLPVDLDRFDRASVRPRLRTELGLGNKRIVGTVGLLKEQKGHRYLIEAAPHILRTEPDAHFVLVGDGALRAELERTVRDHGLANHFSFLGLRQDIPELVADFDVFALPSTFEGMCLAVAEALALEKPVVATSVGGVPQTVIPGETGVLVQPGDADALAEGLLWTLQNPVDAQRMAVAGSRLVRRLYPPERMIAETSALYDRLLTA